MKRFLILITMLTVGAAFPAGALNVKDFGAKGDGVADDSTAIQQAVRQAEKNRHRELLGAAPLGIPDQPTVLGVGEVTDIPEIFLPAGTYRLTKTIVGTSYTIFRGEPGTVVVMEDATQDIFYFLWAFRNRIENIEFRGGKNQLLVCTCNNESARIIVRNCRFVNAAAAGIDCNSFQRPGGTDYRTNPLPAYEVKWENNTPILTPNDLRNKGAFNNSTLFLCADSVFSRCATAVNSGADGVTIQDCKVEATGKNIPFILGVPYHGHARILRMVGRATDASAGVWIHNNTTNLAIRDCDFSGKPMRLVHQTFPGDTNIPSSLLVTDTKINADPALIDIDNSVAEITPRILEISRVTNTGITTVPALKWRIVPDRKRLLAGRHIDNPALKVYRATLVEWPYRVILSGNTGLSEILPGGLKNSPVIQESRMASLRVPAPKITTHPIVHRLRAVDFGVDLNDATDDTSAMQKCLAAAAKLKGVTGIELPPVRVTVNDTLPLPPACVLTVKGQGQVQQTTPERPIFKGVGIEYLKAENLTLNGGGIGFDVQAKPAAELEFSNLGVYASSFAGIKVRAGKNNRAKLLLQDSTFMSARQVLDSDAAAAQINNIWITSSSKMDDNAVIVNRPGGNMLISNILTVPGILKYHDAPHLPYIKDWPYSENIRWVDNYGKMELIDNRFGGEWMGFCIAYNRDPRATFYYDGGVTCFFNKSSKMCVLYCEFPPKDAVIKNAGWLMHFPNSNIVQKADHIGDKLNITVLNMVY